MAAREQDDDLNYSNAFNSSNSNIEEEFEKIKQQLEMLSKINASKQVAQNEEEDFEGGQSDEDQIRSKP